MTAVRKFISGLLLVIGGLFLLDAVLNAVHGPSLQWYQGGTLHDVSLKDWSKASKRNQVATMADLEREAMVRAGHSDVETMNDTDYFQALKEMSVDLAVLISLHTEEMADDQAYLTNTKVRDAFKLFSIYGQFPSE